MSQRQSNMTVQSALNILSSRPEVTAAMVGSNVKTTIVGNPTIIPVTDKEGKQVYGSDRQPLMKAIYNVKLSSQIAKLNERNQAILKEAIALQSTDPQEAANKLNDYVNKLQISFSEIIRTGAQPKFAQGQSVEGVISMTTTEKGSLLTLDNVFAPKAMVLAKPTAIDSLESLLGTTSSPATGGEQESPMANV